MAHNTFGDLFTISTFGESHGPAIGVVIDGCPSGLQVDKNLIQKELDRRKPGQSHLTSQRKEDEEFEILSGIYDGKTLGSPISIMIRNQDAKSKEYERFQYIYRPSHGDFTYEAKYGVRDYRGGGRSSARETANWVAAGAIAKQLLTQYGVSVKGLVDQIGTVTLDQPIDQINWAEVENSPVRCPDPKTSEAMVQAIEETRKQKDSLGGSIYCQMDGVPAGVGEPVFGKLESRLAQALLSINASKGFEIGSGFKGSQMKGSEHNDPFVYENGQIKTESNLSGGIQGGISNGEPIYCRVAFKPVATIAKPQDTIDNEGNPVRLEGKGRHDPCVIPRAVPIVEAMAALVIADLLLIHNARKNF